MKKNIISILFLLILILLGNSKTLASSSLKIEIPYKNATYESIEKMPSDLVWSGDLSINTIYNISLKSTDIAWYSFQNPYITSTSLNYQQAQCVNKNNKNYCKYPLDFASAPGSYTLTVSDQNNNSDIINFKVKNNNSETVRINDYSGLTQFTWPNLSTVFKTTKGKLVDSKIDFAIGYYNIGDIYEFSLYSDKNKKISSSGKIKMDLSGDQYRGTLKINKKIKDGYYYLTAKSLSGSKIIKSELFYIEKELSVPKKDKEKSVILYLNGTKESEYFIDPSDSDSKNYVIGECLFAKDVFLSMFKYSNETKDIECLFDTGKNIKKSDSKNLHKTEITIWKDQKIIQQASNDYKSKVGAKNFCKNLLSTAEKEHGNQLSYECLWSGNKINPR